jgi:hypothetical protein
MNRCDIDIQGLHVQDAHHWIPDLGVLGDVVQGRGGS